MKTCATFPAKSVKRYTRKRTPSLRRLPGEGQPRLLAKREKTLVKVKEILLLEKEELSRLLQSMRDEYAAFKAIGEQKQMEPTRSDPASFHHQVQRLQSICGVNNYLHKQTTALRLSLSSVKEQLALKTGAIGSASSGASGSATDRSGSIHANGDEEEKAAGSAGMDGWDAIDRDAAGGGGGAGGQQQKVGSGRTAASATVLGRDARPSTTAVVQKFSIVKINKIRKNTPRILEVDSTTKTLTICKRITNPSASASASAFTSTSVPSSANTGKSFDLG